MSDGYTKVKLMSDYGVSLQSGRYIFQESRCNIRLWMFMLPSKKHIALHMLVGQYVGFPWLVQLGTQECFAPEASSFVGRYPLIIRRFPLIFRSVGQAYYNMLWKGAKVFYKPLLCSVQAAGQALKSAYYVGEGGTFDLRTFLLCGFYTSCCSSLF